MPRFASVPLDRHSGFAEMPVLLLLGWQATMQQMKVWKIQTYTLYWHSANRLVTESRSVRGRMSFWDC